MKTFIVSALVLSSMFSSSGVALAAPNSNYWSQKFTSSKQNFTGNYKKPINQNNPKPVATSTPTTPPPPSTTPSTTPSPTATQCSTGWYVTGYFTPIESDYSGATETVTIEGKQYTLTSAFLKEVEMEGWGKTNMGKYIGYWDATWHFASTALDAKGNALSMNTIAVDPSLIKFGTTLTIASLPEGFGTKTFTATDIGSGVIGKHIDVYTGEGSAAKATTYKITGNNNTVCTTN